MFDILPKFTATADEWLTVESIQKYTRIAVDKLLDVAQLDQKAKKQEREPRSEAEEVKQDQPNFKKAIIKETDNFLEAIRLFKLVQVSDLEQLKSTRVDLLSKIETHLKFKTLSDGFFKGAVEELDLKISQLAEQLKENAGFANLILIEVKTIFASTVAKLQGTTEVVQAAHQQHLVSVPQQELKMREVLVKTAPSPCQGSAYSHPANPHFNNPITAVHQVHNSDSRLKFETADGLIGAHPATLSKFTRFTVDASQVAMISVRYGTSCIIGVKFLNKSGAVLLEAGINYGDSTQDIALADGERLIGIRSQQYRDNSDCGTGHCNMVFVLGWMV